ncbi:MAG: hypothetical protein JXR91_09000, partial [Deltaproteobacteria bacterium]|nr:hypothetical protein [Deltaproteobacteria bacterium]
LPESLTHVTTCVTVLIISSFFWDCSSLNIVCKYPGDKWKSDFYKKESRDFQEKYFIKCKTT